MIAHHLGRCRLMCRYHSRSMITAIDIVMRECDGVTLSITFDSLLFLSVSLLLSIDSSVRRQRRRVGVRMHRTHAGTMPASRTGSAG